MSIISTVVQRASTLRAHSASHVAQQNGAVDTALHWTHSIQRFNKLMCMPSFPARWIILLASFMAMYSKSVVLSVQDMRSHSQQPISALRYSTASLRIAPPISSRVMKPFSAPLRQAHSYGREMSLGIFSLAADSHAKTLGLSFLCDCF